MRTRICFSGCLVVSCSAITFGDVLARAAAGIEAGYQPPVRRQCGALLIRRCRHD